MEEALVQDFKKLLITCGKGITHYLEYQEKVFFDGAFDDKIKLKKYISNAPKRGVLLQDNISERRVAGVLKTYRTMVLEMPEKVGKLRNHVDNTNIITIIYAINGKNPIINNSFPGFP